jgi:Rrf2 family protein
MMSQSAEYSLRAVVCLASHPGRPLTIRQVADLTHVPAGYLAKILNALSRANLVTAQRGLNGGFTLRKDPAQITLLDVVQVADPSRRIATCPLGVCGGDLCPLHWRIDAAAEAAERTLASSTVADVLADRSHDAAIPLCKTNPTPEGSTHARNDPTPN